MLDYHQIDLFRRIGYLKFDEFFSQKEIVDVKCEINKQIDQRLSPFVKDESGRIYRLNNLYDRSTIFRSILTNNKLLSCLSNILGPNIEFIKNRHNHATVNTSADTHFRLHRDVLQWTRNIVSVIIYIDESNHETGATQVIPGSHFLPFVGTPNNGGTWMDDHHVFSSLLTQAVPIPVKSGGLLIFDSLLFHSVGPNTTKKSRYSIAAGYTSVDELLPISSSLHRELVLGERLYRGSELKW